MLSAPFPVYVASMTATIGGDGAITYSDAVYHRDSSLIESLDVVQLAMPIS
jgi:murein L,D-transpeptidase YcbB/YkuD